MAGKNVFRCKQFQIIQADHVHKVGTDGVLLGAWVYLQGCNRIIDVGTGTGLIALMLAQRSGQDTSITAIEPDVASFNLAKQNITQSTFRDRIKLFNSSLQNFKTENSFDLVVCNPPFFENSLKPPSMNRERERHSTTLSYMDLINSSKVLLQPPGCLCIVIPITEGNRFIKLAVDSGFKLSRKCAVFSKETKPQERWLLEFSMLSDGNPIEDTMFIMNSKGEWTEEYRLLTQNFYLNF